MYFGIGMGPGGFCTDDWQTLVQAWKVSDSLKLWTVRTHTHARMHMCLFTFDTSSSQSLRSFFFAWKSVSELGSCRTWKVRYLSITLAFVWKATPTMCVSLTAYSTLFMTGQLWLCIWFLNDILQYVSQSERQGFYQPPNFLVFLKLLQLPDITVRWVCQN